jgi:hypothetical protein
MVSTCMVSTNLSNVHVEYKLILRTRWVQVYFTYMVSTNLSYVHVEYKLILRKRWVQIHLTYMVSTNLSYVHGEYKRILHTLWVQIVYQSSAPNLFSYNYVEFHVSIVNCHLPDAKSLYPMNVCNAIRSPGMKLSQAYKVYWYIKSMNQVRQLRLLQVEMVLGTIFYSS